MRAVLYADDFEPITVFELDPWAHQYLIEQGQVRLAVMPRLVGIYNGEDDSRLEMHRWIVNITAESLIRKGRETLMLFTRDEEQALMLKAAFLPGQYQEVQDRESAAFAKGFLHALSGLGR